MTAAVGGGIMTCGLIACLAVADVPVAYLALASFGLLGAFGIAARMRGRGRRAALRARAAAARPRWTAEDREWLRGTGAALTGPQGEAR